MIGGATFLLLLLMLLIKVCDRFINSQLCIALSSLTTILVFNDLDIHTPSFSVFFKLEAVISFLLRDFFLEMRRHLEGAIVVYLRGFY